MNNNDIPVWEKYTLTIEAVSYTHLQSYNFIDTKPPVLGYKLKINPYYARG